MDRMVQKHPSVFNGYAWEKLIVGINNNKYLDQLLQ